MKLKFNIPNILFAIVVMGMAVIVIVEYFDGFWTFLVSGLTGLLLGEIMPPIFEKEKE